MIRLLLHLVILAVIGHAALTAAVVGVDSNPSVGREGAISAVLANPHLQPVPFDDRAPLVVRIANRELVADGTRYDLRWLGAVPGSYDLTRFLVDVDGHTLSGVEPISITVSSVLPPGFPGDLIETKRADAFSFGGYQKLMLVLGLAWLAVLPFFWRRKRRAPVVALVAASSLAEQLRELIDGARGPGLDANQRARLERLLFIHWRERLGLHQLDAPTAMQRLREHPEAGVLLRQLDTWLHAPPGRGTVDVEALLAPYGVESRAGLVASS